MSKTIQIISHKGSLIALTEDGRIFERRMASDDRGFPDYKTGLKWFEIPPPTENRNQKDVEDAICRFLRYNGPASSAALARAMINAGYHYGTFRDSLFRLSENGTIVHDGNEDSWEIVEATKEPQIAEELDALKD